MKSGFSFSTTKLDQVLNDRISQNERERQKLLVKTLTWLDEFGLKYGIHKAYIFGSVTESYRFNQRSDVDIAVEQISPEDFFMVISFLY